MNRITPIAVWAYLVIATIIEAMLVNNPAGLGPALATTTILVLAATQVGGIAAVNMHLKDEPRSVVGVAGASIFFAVLAVVLFLASIGH
jgi:heme/copper-type cytochrome/quinol oxidase subunit 4